MQIKVYVIDVGLPRWAGKALALVGIPALIIVGATALVRADVVVVQEFTGGETLSSAKLNGNFTALRDALNNYPACPRGYTAAGPAASFLTESTVCKKGNDELVRVGTGAAAFWIDRYEASGWTTQDGQPGTQLPGTGDDYANAGLPRNGQGKGVYALSIPNVTPSASVTWFQAAQACRASGKRLPNGEEWLAAARGTADPNSNDGSTNTRCSTGTVAVRLTNKALGSSLAESCVSDWGAEEMIGNLMEWTSEWFAGLGNNLTATQQWPDTIGGSYNADGTWMVSSAPFAGPPAAWTAGLPSAAIRGGTHDDPVPTTAGIFALRLEYAPSHWNPHTGFRCVVPGG